MCISDKVREANGCVLVHCLAGISRSPTLAIAYIMTHLGLNTEEAYKYVHIYQPTQQITIASQILLPNEHETLNHSCFNVGPAPQTMAQH